jgi:Tol biopolymer transport system component/DNA-binding winged helix-turn-helix (wHTH) protein
MAVLNSESSEIIRFSVFEVNRHAGELRRNGLKLRLQEQPFQILLSLLERPGQVVTRDELRARLWPGDTFVDFDHGLNAAVRRLRDALGDSAETPRFVETVARRGYRFIAPVNGGVVDAGHPKASPSYSHPRWPIIVAVAALLFIGVIVGWLAGRRSAVPRNAQERRLTANPFDTPVLSSALSPDGKYLAFADKTGFYLRQTDNGETHALALPRNFDAQPAAWFPDGSHLLVTWASGPQEPSSLWEISVMGGTPRRLTDSAHDPAVSPDGSQIAFLRGSLAVPEIWLMRPDGSNARKLIGQEEAPFGPVAWSPDGKKIAYYKSVYHFGKMPFDNDIRIMDLLTRRTESIMSDPRLGPGLAWTQDGRLIYSMSEPPPSQNDSNLWAMPIDSRSGRPTAPATRITRLPGYVGSISLTADGKKLAMMKFDWQPDVYIANLENHGTRLSTPQRLTLDERMDFPYSWTPDSRSVFFDSDRDGTFHIFKQNIDSPIAELVVGGDQSLSGPRLSPDGSMLIYLTSPKLGDKDEKVRLMRVPIAGGPPQLVLEAPRIVNQQCAHLPSQLCIYSEVSPGEERFFQFDPLTGATQEMLWAKIEGKDPYNFNWTLSPDGRLLAVAKKNGVTKEPGVSIYSLADHTQRSLKVQTWAGISSIDWAADSRNLWAVAYTTRDTWALLKVDLEGRVSPMLEEKQMRIGWAIPSPDGLRLALWEASGSANAWLVEDF